MENLLNKNIIQLVSNQIDRNSYEEAGVYDYDLKPSAEQGELLRYDISVEISTPVTFVGNTQENYKSYDDGESWDDVEHEHDLNVTVVTSNSESAFFYVNKETGEIDIPEIRYGNITEVVNVEKVNSFDEEIYSNSIKDPLSWEDDYRSYLNIKGSTFSVDPETLFLEE